MPQSDAMTCYDVFNGDADGIASLLQLRLAHPADARLVTGPKRDIRLVERVAAVAGDDVTVLDVALAANRAAVERLLAAGVRVEYFDHHDTGPGPLPAGLVAHLDRAPDVCTGILVDRHLGGTQRIWAVVAAFGDNLPEQAQALAGPLALDASDLAQLAALADVLTYNTYADRLDDAIVAPDVLFQTLLAARDPLRFVRDDAVFARIDAARRRDLAAAASLEPAYRRPGAHVYILPDAAWTRRIRGIFGNEVARREPTLAHAVLSRGDHGEFVVSVRAPRAQPTGADVLCRAFATGNGRSAAAGIQRLASADLDRFVACLDRAYPGSG